MTAFVDLLGILLATLVAAVLLALMVSGVAGHSRECDLFEQSATGAWVCPA